MGLGFSLRGASVAVCGARGPECRATPSAPGYLWWVQGRAAGEAPLRAAAGSEAAGDLGFWAPHWA